MGGGALEDGEALAAEAPASSHLRRESYRRAGSPSAFWTRHGCGERRSGYALARAIGGLGRELQLVREYSVSTTAAS